MKKAVFPETVVEGLNRWRANARKNVAVRNNTSPWPSLETSPSFGTSPSFSPDASYSVKYEQPISNSDQYLPVEIQEIQDEGKESISRETEEHQKGASFGGFDVRNVNNEKHDY